MDMLSTPAWNAILSLQSQRSIVEFVFRQKESDPGCPATHCSASSRHLK